jgi:uncharacterized damage-inducible protein DinB
MTDEQLRIRGYLQAQAAKRSPADVVEAVRTAMAQLRAAAEAVPGARFEERPEPEEWSANEVMAHVVAAGRHFGDRIVSILDDRPPGASARDAEAGPHTAGQWWTILERDRAELFARVLGADPQTRLHATIEHRMFGPLNWREALLFVRLHDLDHAGQLQKIVTAFGGPPPA